MGGGASLDILTILALGFVLGMRHALDADHVVAVATMVSKTRSLFGSSIIGAFWGVGHTITLFLVGVLILTL
ncbi:MAG TPA: urease accessory protein UreH, partial [Nitrospiria bacterium]|nr:urease accessory protein UreH [Nitrospiria bacterium]